MKSKTHGRLLRWLVIAVAFIAVVGWLLYNWYLPTTLVDVGIVSRGPMEVTVQEDGKTRIKDRYVVSSPLMGKLVRIELEPGDVVLAKQTVAASIRPTEPSLLDTRQKLQAQAREKAAQLAVEQAKSKEAQVRTQLDLAERTFGRLSKLGSSVSQQDLQVAEAEYRTQTQAISVAGLATQIAEFELQQAQAALLHVSSDGSEDANQESADFQVYSPIDGKVLRVLQESAAIVQPGTPLLELGDPGNLEIEVDVLSNQAVRIAAGNRVLIEHWGGDQPLHGVVRRVEPAGFTKISALGVEEQRVNVIIDLIESPVERPTLGDSYRVETQIAIWQADNVLQVPSSALFRTQTDWSVFVVENGVLQVRKIEISHRNRQYAEVISGLDEKAVVVLHPTDQLQEGTRVQVRQDQ
jgi:HlyD family secretion protein